MGYVPFVPFDLPISPPRAVYCDYCKSAAVHERRDCPGCGAAYAFRSKFSDSRPSGFLSYPKKLSEMEYDALILRYRMRGF
jgi:hypothetical protein